MQQGLRMGGGGKGYGATMSHTPIRTGRSTTVHGKDIQGVGSPVRIALGEHGGREPTLGRNAIV